MDEPQKPIYYVFVFTNPDKPTEGNWHENTGFDTDINAVNLLESKAIKELMARGYTRWKRIATVYNDNQPME